MALSDILKAMQEERKKGLNFKKQAEYYRAKFKREEMLKVRHLINMCLLVLYFY